MRGPEVEAWQRFLRAKGFYKGPIDGDFDDDTQVATIAYQQRNGLVADGVVTPETTEKACREGFDPSSANNGPHYKTEGNVVLSSSARTYLERIATLYYRETGVDFIVTSGTRTPAAQADAMYRKLRRGENLRSLYSNHRALDEILNVYDYDRRSGASERATIEAMSRVIQTQVSKHVYISRHLDGKGVDVRTRTMSSSQKEVFQKACRQVLGQGPIKEADHYHLQF